MVVESFVRVPLKKKTDIATFILSRVFSYKNYVIFVLLNTCLVVNAIIISEVRYLFLKSISKVTSRVY